MAAVAIGKPIYPDAIVLPQVADGQAKKANNVELDGWPPGLNDSMHLSQAAFPLRFVIVDNSGSMQSNDGQRLVHSGSTFKSIACTRWVELGDLCKEVMHLSITLNLPTHFHLLNPSDGGEQFYAVGDDGNTMLGKRADGCVYDQDGSRFRKALGTSPLYRTPLTEAVTTISNLVRSQKDKLVAHGQQVVVVLCTDGLPDDPHSFLCALQELQRLPVWLVVRLCTDESAVVDYWSELDRQLERPLETLDDLKSEAEEVHAKNPWIAYGPAFHVARTVGLRDKLFDLLDEQKLLPSQAKQLIERLLGCDELPEPEIDIDAFLAAVERAQAGVQPTYNPVMKQMTPWILVDKLRRAFGKDEGCAVM